MNFSGMTTLKNINISGLLINVSSLKRLSGTSVITRVSGATNNAYVLSDEGSNAEYIVPSGKVFVPVCAIIYYGLAAQVNQFVVGYKNLVGAQNQTTVTPVFDQMVTNYSTIESNMVAAMLGGSIPAGNYVSGYCISGASDFRSCVQIFGYELDV